MFIDEKGIFSLFNNNTQKKFASYNKNTYICIDFKL